ncbi:MAG: DUF4129 domain-containing protein [Actinomycetes bacterium]
MGAGAPPEPPSGRETGARIVVVVGLVSLAALGLSGRRGIDWTGLFGVPNLPWAVVLLALVGVALVLVVVRLLVRMVRRRRRPPDTELAGAEIAPRWFELVLAGLLVVLALAGVVAIAYTFLNRDVDRSTDGSAGDGGGGPTGVADDRLWALVVGLLLVVAAGAVLAVLARLRSAQPEPEETPPAQRRLDPADEAVLDEALVAAGAALDAHDDVRAAIIAAWTTMTATLARRGATARSSDTPTELLDRAVASGLVPPAAARELTELFREARFSTHPLPAAARDRAEAALARVRAELGVGHG